MEYLLIKGGVYLLYHDFKTLCKENGIDHKKLKESMLPANTPVGLIIALIPNTKVTF